MENNKNTPVIYSNSVGISCGAFDVTLHIGMQMPEGDFVPQAIVFLSWPHAKKLVEILQNEINRYEKMYGQIKTEPNPDVIKEMQEKGEIEIINQEG